MGKNEHINHETASRLKRRPLRHLNEVREGIKVSFEYFPPRTSAATESFELTSKTLNKFQPAFTSMTYGAGGSSETESFAALRQLKKLTTQQVAAHITWFGQSRDEVDGLAERLAQMGVRRLVALRGEFPEANHPNFHPDGYHSTADMIAGLKQLYPFDISVAGYPEVHPKAASAQTDLDVLKSKVDAGADRVLCQFCYDSDQFLRFRDKAVAGGITAPIIPGILPINDFKKVEAFASKCGASIPRSIAELLSDINDQQEIFDVVSATITAEFCTRLIDNGVVDFHFYTLNHDRLTRAICYILGLREKNETHATAVVANRASFA